ncbi:methyltransferase domain-containing protein [Chromobacterium sp. IIBBL 290-4]|uniref:methyltransferase domain-containing protein n=1 Tax=Chromobacterium sp. IIBBL 290-4 TaxID=2953890 RepID=UPI0020B6D8D3|nr:methyltransferase domain-containing protein [Chromobacterium sp. IIBBL 290-4]UTH76247.1 methyltransferase domain-containing protein [Chromobacterium sp. IIBBL 290-4]
MFKILPQWADKLKPTNILRETAKRPISFLSFDVEALPGRHPEDTDAIDRLIWGKVANKEYGLRRICRILGEHNLQASFMIDMAACALYGDKAMRQVGDYLRNQGHELQVHLHSEWLLRQWGLPDADFGGPAGCDQLDARLNQAFLQYSALKFYQLYGEKPQVFRAGAFRFNQHTIDAALSAGFVALSQFNAQRHAGSWQAGPAGQRNELFYWPNGMLELPVDCAPEPLSSNWQVYEGAFSRVKQRKRIQTFNLTLHSWSLMRRNGEIFDSHAPEHEERLHRICQHLTKHTRPMTYRSYLNSLPARENPVCHAQSVPVTGISTSCSICGGEFGQKPQSDICPACGARARHRQLLDVFTRIGNPLAGRKVLANFANRLELHTFLKPCREVLNFDIRPVGECNLQMDVQDMHPVDSASYDGFFSIHILNHVQNDERALAEMYRVLTPGGVTVLTVPCREHEPTTSNENQTEHYGEAALKEFGVGSFRRYGLNDLQELLGRIGFQVQVEQGEDFMTGEFMPIFILTKPALDDISNV